mmetsp:Transcript_130251/g.405136  ORF Transcript_130251/g.405136 Transcript_130251/m.405136 type:complete len:336 (-) Transcript_130251:37-1044(-)
MLASRRASAIVVLCGSGCSSAVRLVRDHPSTLGAAGVAPLAAGGTLGAKPAILWLGDSRSREVALGVLPRVCGDDAWHWNWTQPAEDIFNGSSVAGGALCRPDADLAALAFFLSYGVADDGMYFRDAYSTKRHQRWSAEGGGCGPHSRCVLNTHLLAKEAVRRFALQSPRGVPRVLLLSALAWDFGRHHAHFPNQEPRAWAEEYGRNFSRLARSAQSSLQPGDRLVLIADYPRLCVIVACGKRGQESKSECLRVEFEMARLAAAQVGRIAKELGASFVDLHHLLMADGTDKKLRAWMRMDGQHPNSKAVDSIWAEIWAEVSKPPAGSGCCSSMTR